MEWYIPIDYSKDDNMFIYLNYYYIDEGMWTYSKFCSEELKDVNIKDEVLDIHTVLYTALEGKCNSEKDGVELIYRFKYDSNAKKYVLNYVYFIVE